ncbi:MAG: putative ABC exporter domain-containing protein [Gemmatimonadaceae bacterium]
MSADATAAEATTRGDSGRGAGGAGGTPVGIVGAYVFLTWHSARNRFLQQARRLRNPRYIVALVLGVVYFYVALFRQTRPTGNAPGFLFGTGADAILALGLVALTTRWWLFGGDQTALAFSPAEVQFLFPAPVSRRSLVHFKLLRSQVVVLLNTLLWVVLLRKGSASLSLWARALAFWVMFSTLTLHRLGASLVRASAREHGAAGARRGIVPIAVFAVVVGSVTWALVGALPVMRTATSPAELFGALKHALAAPLPATVLLPFRAVLRPSLAGGLTEWARTFWPALLIMVLHYAWVVRTNAAFEEAAIEASARRAARVAAIRDGRGLAAAAAAARGGRVPRPWFPLAPTGEPAVALLWKNVVSVTRAFRWTSVLFLVLGIGALLVVVAYQSSPDDAAGLLATIVGVWAGLTVLTGPLWVRNDLRQDLPKLALLRAYPLRGARVVGAQVASSTIVLTTLQYVLLTIGFVALLADPDAPLTPGGRALALGAIFALLPAVNAASLCIQNAVALLFPSWVRLGPTHGRPGGVEAMGQNLLTTVLALIVLSVLLVLPVATGGAAGYLLRHTLGRAGWAIGLAVAIAMLAAEVLGMVRWLGKLFERTEPMEMTG